MIIVFVLLGAVMLLLQLQSGAITLPAGKPKADSAAADAPSTATLSGDPAEAGPIPDLTSVRRRLAERDNTRRQNRSRDYLASQSLAKMDPDAAAALLGQWPPEQAASALQRLRARHLGPILDAAPSATASAWLQALRQPETLPALSPQYSQLAAEAGWQDQYPDEELGWSADEAAPGSDESAAQASGSVAEEGQATTQDDTTTAPADAGAASTQDGGGAADAGAAGTVT